jgi:hypothetical protein
MSTRICADPKCRTKFTPVAEWHIFCSKACAVRVSVRRFRARQRYGDDGDGGPGKRQSCLFPGGVTAKAKRRKPAPVPQPVLFPPEGGGPVGTLAIGFAQGENGELTDLLVIGRKKRPAPSQKIEAPDALAA